MTSGPCSPHLPTSEALGDLQRGSCFLTFPYLSLCSYRGVPLRGWKGPGQAFRSPGWTGTDSAPQGCCGPPARLGGLGAQAIRSCNSHPLVSAAVELTQPPGLKTVSFSRNMSNPPAWQRGEQPRGLCNCPLPGSVMGSRGVKYTNAQDRTEK